MIQTGFGGPEVVRLEHLPEPAPGPGDVLVRVRACALNQLDSLQRRGPGLLPDFRLPHIAGMDVAGRVAAVGTAVDHLQPGDPVLLDPTLGCGSCDRCRDGQPGHCPSIRVVGGNIPGGFAEYVAVPA
ncbi:alcohol dehydrogenase catalytic domain-containing protein, partial [Micromonospora echinofusca]